MKRFFNQLISWVTGFAIGAGIGGVLIALFVPISSQEVRERLQQHYDDALAEAKKAARQERARLHAELAELTGQQQDKAE